MLDPNIYLEAAYHLTLEPTYSRDFTIFTKDQDTIDFTCSCIGHTCWDNNGHATTLYEEYFRPKGLGDAFTVWLDDETVIYEKQQERRLLCLLFMHEIALDLEDAEEPKEKNFFLNDDESGFPWMACSPDGVLDYIAGSLAGMEDGDNFRFDIKRQDLTKRQLEALPEL